MGETLGTVCIGFNRMKLAWILVGSLMLLGLCAWILSIGDAEMRVLAWCVIPLFGFTALYSLRNLIVKKNALILSPEGISDFSAYGSPGFVPWSAVRGAFRYRFNGHDSIVFDLVAPETYIHRLSPVARMIRWSNQKAFNTPLQINAYAINMDFEGLCRLLDAYLAAFKNVRIEDRRTPR